MENDRLITPEELAQYFHEEYERMASAFQYETRRETAVPWEDVMDSNKKLMVAVATSVLLHFFPDRMSLYHGQQEKIKFTPQER